MVSACFTASAIQAVFTTSEYPLKNSAILDSGATLHVFNQISRFNNFRTAPAEDKIFAGDHTLAIKGYGDVDICLQNAIGDKHLLRLNNVAFVPGMATNLVSLRPLRARGIWWDTRPQTTALRRADGTALGILEERYGQFVLEYVPTNHDRAAFFTRRNRLSSWTKRGPRRAEAWLWHLRLGHPGPKALEHLVNSSEGVRIKGPTTTQCDSCAQAKMKRQIQRAARRLNDFKPGEKIALDFHDFEEDPDGYSSLMLLIDRVSGYMWDFYLQDRTTDSIIAALASFLGMMDLHFGIKIKAVETDNEIYTVKPRVKEWLEERHIRIEPSPPHTQALNGAAERSGGVVKEKINAMRSSSKLPVSLWREISKAAIYLLNRTPRRRIKWKTPFEIFHSTVTERRKPDLTNLRAYGCKSYAMTTTAMLKGERLKRFNPKAWIGYLVGYTSSNTYRIWNPVTNQVIHTRDVIFDEQETFSGVLEELRDDVREMDRDELARLLSEFSIPEQPDEQVNHAPTPEGVDDVLQQSVQQSVQQLVQQPAPLSGTSGVSPAPAGGLECESGAPGPVGSQLYTTARFELLPTPPPSPPAALLTAVMTGSVYPTRGSHHVEGLPGDAWSTSEVENAIQHSAFHARALCGDIPTGRAKMNYTDVWKGAFYAGTKATVVKAEHGRPVTRAVFQRLQRLGKRFHRRDMPEPPQRHSELAEHPCGELFAQAEADHLQGHAEMRSWTEISSRDERVRGHKVLDCRWVYVYKFDKHGRFVKAKARLVVRGDQQLRGATENNYAATLAGRSFRTVMAIAARFNLELLQFDAVNAFVNADLDEDVFMRMPPGHRRFGTILKLNKALYGLRRSPLLWQRTLSGALQKLGFKAVPHEPCAFTRNGVIIFFYVDDIVIAFREAQRQEALRTIIQLRSRYQLTGGEPLQWFLGMEVLRDRTRGLIWLSQASYIDKIAALAQTNTPSESPMAKEELLPYEGTATAHDITVYLRKVGSVLYAAVITRPDISFAVSRLARFSTNPGPLHQKAADRVLLYLQRTASLALQFGGNDDLYMASDASFADNTLDRKSSQGFAMKLFGGLIAWRANKQDTVTTSTTEAELLALSQAAKEGLFVARLLKELGVTLDTRRLVIEVDNKQTIRLVTEEIARLKTSLRHVDIHNHWLRQEYAAGKIDVQYTKSAEMMADGLTKALVQEQFAGFRKQLGMVNISEMLAIRREQEDRKDEGIQEDGQERSGGNDGQFRRQGLN